MIVGVPTGVSRVKKIDRAMRNSFEGGVGGAAYDYTDLSDEKLAWRRNRLFYTEQFENAASAWSRVNNGTASAPIITPNYSVAPDGSTTARRLQMALNGGTSSADICSIFQVISGVRIGQAVSQGVWLKTNDGTTKNVQFRDDFSGTVGTIISVTSVWQRFVVENVPTTPTGGGTINAIRLWLRGAQGTSDSADLSIWGAQLVFGPVLGEYQRITDVNTEFLLAFPYHSLFQDSLATLATYALEQPIGFSGDVRFGMVRLLEKYVGQVPSPVGTGVSASGSSLVFSGSAATGAYGGYSSTVSASKFHEIIFEVYELTSGAIGFDPDGSGSVTSRSTNGIFKLISLTGTNIYFASTVANTTGKVRLLSVKEVPGNHRKQNTVGDRPVVTGRYNSFVNSQADVAQAAGSTPPTVVSRNTLYGESCASATFTSAMSAGYANSRLDYNASTTAPIVNGVTYVWAYKLALSRALTGSESLYCYVTGGSGFAAVTLTVDNCAPYVGKFATVTASSAASANGSVYPVVFLNNTLTSNLTVSLCKAQFALGTTIGPYQAVNTATDYDATGFPKGARFNGTNSWMSAKLDLSTSDKLGLVISTRKDSDSAAAILLELSANVANAPGGTYYISAPESAGASGGFGFRMRMNGDSANRGYQSSAPAAPATVVLSMELDGALTTMDAIKPQVNGVAATGNPTTAPISPSGNMANDIEYIGRRGGASLPFSGIVYRDVRRSGLSTAYMNILKAWVNEPVKVLP